MLIPLLAAAALMIAPDCDLERPSGAPDCTRAAVDVLPMNRMQVVQVLPAKLEPAPVNEADEVLVSALDALIGR